MNLKKTFKNLLVLDFPLIRKMCLWNRVVDPGGADPDPESLEQPGSGSELKNSPLPFFLNLKVNIYK